MRVFCIVGANLYLNGTDQGRTDKQAGLYLAGMMGAEQNVKTND